MITSLSFCILNWSQSNKALSRCIKSIRSQNMPQYEILVYGNGNEDDGIKYFNKEDWIKQGAINKMRNSLCNIASKEFIVLMDANVELAPDWYSNMMKADCFDIIGSRLITTDDKRAIDWAYQIRLDDQSFPFPLQYDEWTTKAYISGMLMVVRRSVWEQVKFTDNLLFWQDDDVEFCLRSSDIGFRLGVFPDAAAIYHYDQDVCQWRKYITFDKPLGMVRDYKCVSAEGNNAFKNGDYDAAVKYFQRVIEITPKDISVWSDIGWAHYLKNRYDEAIKAFDEAVALDSKNNYAMRGRGWAHLQKGNYEHAVRDLSKALEYIDGNDKDSLQEAFRGRGWAYYYLNGNFKKAIEDFSNAIENTDEHNKDILQNLFRGRGLSYYRSGLLNEAVQDLKHAGGMIAYTPKVCFALWSLASSVKHGLTMLSKRRER